MHRNPALRRRRRHRARRERCSGARRLRLWLLRLHCQAENAPARSCGAGPSVARTAVSRRRVDAAGTNATPRPRTLQGVRPVAPRRAARSPRAQGGCRRGRPGGARLRHRRRGARHRSPRARRLRARAARGSTVMNPAELGLRPRHLAGARRSASRCSPPSSAPSRTTSAVRRRRGRRPRSRPLAGDGDERRGRRTADAAPARASAPRSRSASRSPRSAYARPMIQLGLNPDRSLEVPTDFGDTGWWSGGARARRARPGGHRRPRRLEDGPGRSSTASRELRPGDKIVVVGRDGSRARFTVEGSEQYPKDRLPDRARLRSTRTAPTLRLITCWRRRSTAPPATTSTTRSCTRAEPSEERMTTQALPGQTVVVIGGSAGIGLETARRARAEGADVILTGRDPTGSSGQRTRSAPEHRGLRRQRHGRVEAFFDELPDPIDQCWSRPAAPTTGPCSRWTPMRCARRSAITWCWRSRSRATPPARCGPAARCCSWAAPAAGGSVADSGIASAATAALPPFTAALALELAPVRVNLIAAGFVDTPLSASLLGDDSRSAATSCGRHFRSAASSARPTSPHWPSTS